MIWATTLYCAPCPTGNPACRCKDGAGYTAADLYRIDRVEALPIGRNHGSKVTTLHLDPGVLIRRWVGIGRLLQPTARTASTRMRSNEEGFLLLADAAGSTG